MAADDAVRRPAAGRAETYVHGHHESVLRSHRWRTAQNSAAHLLPLLRPGLDLLDVGCGPGTITVDLARAVAPGRTVGVDLFEDVLVKAGELAGARGVDTVVFERADAYDLPYANASFDVVHAHQVLQYLGDPVAALREMRRVTRPGGLVSLRESDYDGMAWYPESAGLAQWARVYGEVCARHGAHLPAGRRLLAWAREAGFEDVTASASAWCFADDDERSWWGQMWADRMTSSAIARQAVAAGVATDEDLAGIAHAWRDWSEREDGWFAVLHGEVLARR